MSQRAYVFLEDLQRQVYSSLGTMPRRYDDAFIREQAEKWVRSVQPDLAAEELARQVDVVAADLIAKYAEVPTPYEDAGGYFILSELRREVEQSIRDLGLPLPAPPAFGSLPTGQVNALTIAVPRSDEHVILFEDELFTFALLFSKAVVRAFPSTGQADADGNVGFTLEPAAVQQRVRDDPSVLDRFADVVLAYALTGNPSRAEQYWPEADYGRLAELARESMELFVLGHEYGHIIAGHLGDASVERRMLPAQSVDEVSYAWGQEFEADYIGVALGVRSMNRSKGVDASLSFWGADLFFSALDVMDRCTSLLRHGDEGVQTLGSHPPSAERRQGVRLYLSRLLGDEASAGAIQLAEMVEQAVETLWTELRPYVRRLHEAGRRPAPAWG